MAITTLAPWFGGKRTLTSDIVNLMRPHRCYWEPMCGGVSVILGKTPCAMETLNDLHGDLVNMARVIQHDRLGPMFYRRLRRTMMSETLHAEAAERWKDRGNTPAGDAPDMERAYDYFLCSWLGRNGVAGTQSYNQGFCVRYTANGGHAAKRFKSAIESIPAWRERLRNVTILNRDVFTLLDRIDDEPRTVIYLDPPYVVKGSKYTHDFTPEDHARLAAAVRRFKHAQVLVSYYEHPLVRELYAGWTFHTFEVSKALVNQGARDGGGAVKATELVIVNEGAGLFGGAA